MAVNNRTRKLMFSTGKAESASSALSYGTAQAVDSLMKLGLDAIPEADHQIINDQDLLGGTEEASDQEIIAQSYRLPFAQPRVKPHTLAFWAAYLFGKIVTATPVGATATRKHTITPKPDDPEMPSFTTEELIKVGLQKKYPGCLMADGTLRINRGANRMVSLNGSMLIGGTKATGSGSVTEKSESAINAGSNCAVFLGAVSHSGSTDDNLDIATTDLSGSPTDLKSKVRSIECQASNNYDAEDLYRLGAGLGFGAAERGDRTQLVTLNFDYDDETEIDRLENQTAVALQVKIRGALIESGFYYGMNLIYPKLKYASHRRAIDKGKQVNQVTMQVLEDATYGSMILDVFNQQTEYLGLNV